MGQKKSQRSLRFSRQFSAPRGKVFALFASHERFGAALGGPAGVKLGALRRIKTSEEPGNPDGLGSVRRIGFGPSAFEETIVGFESGKRIEYRISRGSPLKNHLGQIEFRDVPGGTQVDYSIRFEPRIPGTGGAIALLLHSLISSGLNRIENEFGAL